MCLPSLVLIAAEVRVGDRLPVSVLDAETPAQVHEPTRAQGSVGSSPLPHPRHRRAVRILDLDPRLGPARAVLHLASELRVALLRHVYRIRPEPELAARHSAAGELSRRRKNQKAHDRQSVRLADRDRRRPAHAAQGRESRAGRSGDHRGAPRVAARPCRGRARRPRARKPLRGEAAIALKVGAVVNRRKMAKHFDLVIGEVNFAFHRKAAAIAAEAALDGIYVVRTSLPQKALDNAATVGAYKSLAQVERAFRSLKTVDIHLRPIFHWTAPRVRAHVFLCMLAYHVEHHMRARLAPMLYDETDHEAAAAMRASIVAKAERSDAAKRKQTTGRTDDGLPVHSFQSLLADLATYCRIQATTALNEKYVLTLHTRPTPIQSRAFELLAINPDRTQ